MDKKISGLNDMKQKIEDILFYASANVKPPKRGLDDILNNLPVTDYRYSRYNNMMGLKFAVPAGIIILVLMVLVSVNKKPSQPQTITVLPATVTKQNVDTSLNKVDSAISESQNQMDQDMKELDQEETQQNPEDGSSEQSDDLNDL